MAALLLLLGVMLGGGFDAIVCEPSTEIAVAAVDSADHDSHQQGPDSDRHGGCIHGHCHHGAQSVPVFALLIDPPLVQEDYVPSGGPLLASIAPDSLKRPPRA